MKIHFTIPNNLNNLRFDHVVASTILECSRSRAVNLINKGALLINGAVKKPGYKVKTGERIKGFIPEATILIPEPEPIDIDIIHEDPYILVINKSPGMVVHPAPGNYSGTLVNALLNHHSSLSSVGNDMSRVGIVHRLDKDTSGAIVVAKTDFAFHFLQKEFKQRRVKKKYIALVMGIIKESEGEIDLPVGRHPVKRKLMCVNQENGKPAQTRWKINKRLKNACMVEAHILTGRTHQIRVHFYALNHPLVGDKIYQHRRYRKKTSIAPRQMLHSRQISFRHPFSGVRVSFKAKIPEDFLKVKSMLE
ncbi:MAG: RluA family pseudouridine synthase [Desulfobacteraceae bacterium]|nr:RluA family pseudouridine synthase [Desulfobacteraceae bacterium]